MQRFFISLLLLLIGTSLAFAQPFTRRSSQMQHDGLKKTYEISNFRLGGKYDLSDPSKWENGGEGGTTLESLGAGKLRTAYIAIGTPRRNAAGEITNAVVINSYYSGDSTDMYEQWVKGTALSGGVPVIGPGRPIDTDRYYVVMVDPLGTWGASKPSDGLGIKFPQYSYYDMVQANYRMLRDQLKVARVALVTGVSMGGTQTYVWGVMHPEFIGALMPIGGTTQSDAEDPVGNWTFQLMTAAIEADPVWQSTKGDYYKLPKGKASDTGPRLRLVGAWPHRLRLRLQDVAELRVRTARSVLLGSAEREGRQQRDQSRQAVRRSRSRLAQPGRRDPQHQSLSRPHPGPHIGDAYHQRPVAELQAGRARR